MVRLLSLGPFSTCCCPLSSCFPTGSWNICLNYHLKMTLIFLTARLIAVLLFEYCLSSSRTESVEFLCCSLEELKSLRLNWLLNLKSLFPVLAEIEIFHCLSQNLVAVIAKPVSPKLPKFLFVIYSLVTCPPDSLLFWHFSIGRLESSLVLRRPVVLVKDRITGTETRTCFHSAKLLLWVLGKVVCWNMYFFDLFHTLSLLVVKIILEYAYLHFEVGIRDWTVWFFDVYPWTVPPPFFPTRYKLLMYCPSAGATFLMAFFLTISLPYPYPTRFL